MRSALPIRLTWTVALVGALASASPAVDFPFTGVITGNDVNIRAGAGTNYYAATQLDEGALVEVQDNQYGWYLITPPPGSFSYISKAFVAAEGDGTEGVVTGNRVRVRAPSPAGPEKSYRTQAMLNEGDRVSIVGSDGNYFKIVPPDPAMLFVKSDYVREATAADLASVRAAEEAEPEAVAGQEEVEDTGPPIVDTAVVGQTTETTDDDEPQLIDTDLGGGDIKAPTIEMDTDTATEAATATDTGDVEEAPTAEVADAEPAPADVEEVTDAVERAPDARIRPYEPDNEKLAAVERRFDALRGTSVDDQPLDELLAAYRRLAAEQELSSTDERVVEARIALLEDRRELLATLQEIRKIRDQMDTEESAAEPEREPAYTAVGRLLTSPYYDGKRLPLMYRLVDPLSERTIAYIKPSVLANVRNLLGRIVGIVGDIRHDEATNLRIITVNRADVLAPAR